MQTSKNNSISGKSVAGGDSIVVVSPLISRIEEQCSKIERWCKPWTLDCILDGILDWILDLTSYAWPRRHVRGRYISVSVDAYGNLSGDDVE